jgi:hypothetical protein
MHVSVSPANAPLSDLILGASIYFPPIFKAVMLGLVLWLLIHHVLRNWIYSGEIWYLILMDLSIIVIAVSVSLWILTRR